MLLQSISDNEQQVVEGWKQKLASKEEQMEQEREKHEQLVKSLQQTLVRSCLYFISRCNLY